MYLDLFLNIQDLDNILGRHKFPQLLKTDNCLFVVSQNSFYGTVLYLIMKNR